MALGTVLVARVVLPPHGRDPERKTHIRHDIAEGFRWVLHHAAVRTLVLTIFTFNITWGAAWSVLVLYAKQRLGLGDVGFGLVTTVSAVGGLAGTASYGWITRRVSLGNIMRIGLITETLTHLALALTTQSVGRHAGVLRLRRARLHLGNDVGHRAAAGGADGAAGARRAA